MRPLARGRSQVEAQQKPHQEGQAQWAPPRLRVDGQRGDPDRGQLADTGLTCVLEAEIVHNKDKATRTHAEAPSLCCSSPALTARAAPTPRSELFHPEVTFGETASGRPPSTRNLPACPHPLSVSVCLPHGPAFAWVSACSRVQ